MHPKIHDLFNCGDLDSIRILIERTVDGVIQAECSAFIFLRTEQEGE